MMDVHNKQVPSPASSADNPGARLGIGGVPVPLRVTQTKEHTPLANAVQVEGLYLGQPWQVAMARSDLETVLLMLDTRLRPDDLAKAGAEEIAFTALALLATENKVPAMASIHFASASAKSTEAQSLHHVVLDFAGRDLHCELLLGETLAKLLPLPVETADPERAGLSGDDADVLEEPDDAGPAMAMDMADTSERADIGEAPDDNGDHDEDGDDWLADDDGGLWPTYLQWCRYDLSRKDFKALGEGDVLIPEELSRERALLILSDGSRLECRIDGRALDVINAPPPDDEAIRPLPRSKVRLTVIASETPASDPSRDEARPGYGLVLSEGQPDAVDLAVDGDVIGTGTLILVDGRPAIRIDHWHGIDVVETDRADTP